MSERRRTLLQSGSGGGGSLPSVISKIDGGSFTLASDQKGDGYNISHSLGVVPKGFVIWTEDEISGTIATRFLGSCALVMLNLVDKNANTIVASGEATILYNGSITALANVQLNSAQAPYYMNSERIRWNNGLVYFKAGATYKWLAWA